MQSPRTLPFINPATGQQFGQVTMSTPEEIAHAHAVMRRNLRVWRRKSPRERAGILKKFQKVLIDYADEISEVINLDTGKSRQDALQELFLVVDKLHQYCKLAPSWLKSERVPRGLYVFKEFYAEQRPYGVVAVIGPWNLPLDLTIPPVYAALLAGNTVLLKPSEVTPAVGLLIEKLFQSVPELSPYVRVLHGDGGVGAALVDSRPDLIFLTGSTATGKKVARAAAEKMIPFISELGGKDPMIVLEDADIKEAAHWGVWGAFFHVGQTCVSVERVYVVESVYDQFVDAVLMETRQFSYGYSTEKNNPYDMGPFSCDFQVNIVVDHIQDALAKGARRLIGDDAQGCFMGPTVLVDVDHSMKIMRDETFGPVMPIMKVKDEAEAIDLANDSEYGLSACVWSRDLNRAQHVGRQLEVGSVMINDTIAHYAVPLLPFGGVKLSGTARTHGKQDVLQFTQVRAFGVGQRPFPLDIATILRQPNHYELMSGVMHLVFGVTPAQRLKPVVELLRGRQKAAAPVTAPAPAVNGSGPKRGNGRGAAIAGLGAAAAAAALVFGLLRGRR